MSSPCPVWLAALLPLTTACAPAAPPSPVPSQQAPVVALGSAGAAMPASASAVIELPAKPPAYVPCVAAMFDHAPGEHGLTAFEDVAGRYGFRQADGSVAIAPRFRFAYPFSPHGVAAVIDDDGPAFIDRAGMLLARAFVFDNGPDYFTEQRARIVRDGKVGFIDQQGQIVVEPTFGYASAFCHGRAAVCVACRLGTGDHAPVEGGPWGFVDRHGGLAVPLRFDSVKPFEGDRAQVVLAGKPVTIDLEGRVVAAPAQAAAEP